jgi:hypothetical protein
MTPEQGIGLLALTIMALIISVAVSLVAARALVAASEAARLAKAASRDVDNCAHIVGAMRGDMVDLLEWRNALISMQAPHPPKVPPSKATV